MIFCKIWCCFPVEKHKNVIHSGLLGKTVHSVLSTTMAAYSKPEAQFLSNAGPLGQRKTYTL